MEAKGTSIKAILGESVDVELCDGGVPRATRPKEWIMPTHLISNMAFKGELDDGCPREITLIKPGRYHGAFIVRATLDFGMVKDLGVPPGLTRYDKVVYGAVTSLYVHYMSSFATITSHHESRRHQFRCHLVNSSPL